jgi:hypothetical protein
MASRRRSTIEVVPGSTAADSIIVYVTARDAAGGPIVNPNTTFTLVGTVAGPDRIPVPVGPFIATLDPQ